MEEDSSRLSKSWISYEDKKDNGFIGHNFIRTNCEMLSRINELCCIHDHGYVFIFHSSLKSKSTLKPWR